MGVTREPGLLAAARVGQSSAREQTVVNGPSSMHFQSALRFHIWPRCLLSVWGNFARPSKRFVPSYLQSLLPKLLRTLKSSSGLSFGHLLATRTKQKQPKAKTYMDMREIDAEKKENHLPAEVSLLIVKEGRVGE